MENLIVIIVGIVLSVICIIISVLQFREKGFLFNNAYIYASKQERKTMNKKPHYRQSGVVFAFLASIFLCVTAESILKTGWLVWFADVLCIAVIVYAVVSTVKQGRT